MYPPEREDTYNENIAWFNIWFLPIFVLCNVHCFICTDQLLSELRSRTQMEFCINKITETLYLVALSGNSHTKYFIAPCYKLFI